MKVFFVLVLAKFKQMNAVRHEAAEIVAKELSYPYITGTGYSKTPTIVIDHTRIPRPSQNENALFH